MIVLTELRQEWMHHWHMLPHKGIGPTLLLKSIAYKRREQEGLGLSPEQQIELNTLIKQYKRSPKSFDDRCTALKPGTRLLRTWKGKQHSVLVKTNGFDYQETHYSSLSQIANDITGTRWNGHVFFGVK